MRRILLKEIEKKYGVDFGADSDKTIVEFLRKKGYSSLADLIENVDDKIKNERPEKCKTCSYNDDMFFCTELLCQQGDKKMKNPTYKLTEDIAEKRSQAIEDAFKSILPDWEYRFIKYLKKYPGSFINIFRRLSGLRTTIYKSETVELFIIKRFGFVLGSFKLESELKKHKYIQTLTRL